MGKMTKWNAGSMCLGRGCCWGYWEHCWDLFWFGVSNFSGLEVRRNKLESSLSCWLLLQGVTFGTSFGVIKLLGGVWGASGRG